MQNTTRNKLQQTILFTVLAAIAIYGLHYHIAKALMHLAATLSLINITIAIYKKELDRLSLPRNTEIFIALLILSAIVVWVYSSLNSGRVSDRFLKDFSFTAVFIALITPSIRLNKKDIKIVEISLFLSCSLMALTGIYDHFINNVSRTSGNINLSIIYGTNLSILTTLNLMLSIKAFSIKRYLFSGLSILAFILGIMGIAYSGSRGPMIAVLAIAACILLVAGFKFFGKTKGLIIVTTVMIALGFCISELPIGKRLEAGFTNATSENTQGTSIGIRFQLWKAGIHSLINNPISGVGIAKHNSYFEEQLENDPDFIHPSAMNFIHLHNDVLNILVWMGIFGGGLFFAYLIYSTCLFLLNSSSNYPAVLGLIACSTFLICGLTNTPSMRAASLTLLLFIMAICHQMLKMNIRSTYIK